MLTNLIISNTLLRSLEFRILQKALEEKTITFAFQKALPGGIVRGWIWSNGIAMDPEGLNSADKGESI